jgi:hypothetical protein
VPDEVQSYAADLVQDAAQSGGRREALGSVIESTGGKLHGFWYTFGEADGFGLIELPDDVAAACGWIGPARSILKILLGLAGAVAVSQCYRHAG